MKGLTINNSDIIPSSIRLIDNKQFHFAIDLKPEKTSIESIYNYRLYYTTIGYIIHTIGCIIQ